VEHARPAVLRILACQPRNERRECGLIVRDAVADKAVLTGVTDGLGKLDGERQVHGEHDAQFAYLPTMIHGVLRVLSWLLFALTASLAMAQSYPSRSIRLVVDTSPGGITDLLARLCGEGLSQKLAQPVFVDNKHGGSGNVGMEFGVRWAAVGCTPESGAGGMLVV